ncbi:Synapsin, ATP binding domain containing protein [Histomonas meleagridis]|nr:Synapsin, ATP binding domain containing protein [Histomonas meleagridis]KAH0801175.1 Synapsin, ATP binding domain containing protein [Histomonas meleagridis]
METFSIDTIIGKDGKEYILETNGSAQGFTPEHKDEALAKLRDLILSKFQKKENVSAKVSEPPEKEKKEKEDKKDKKEKDKKEKKDKKDKKKNKK